MSEVRLIDANALKEEVNHNYLVMKNTRVIEIGWLNEYVIDCMPTIEPEITEKQAILFLINSGWLVNHDKELREKWEKPQGEWILVSERLPEENVCDDGYHEPSKWVLVQARNGHMYTTRYWTRDKKNVWTDLDYPDDIIAWQPLPERYRKEGEEE